MWNYDLYPENDSFDTRNVAKFNKILYYFEADIRIVFFLLLRQYLRILHRSISEKKP